LSVALHPDAVRLVRDAAQVVGLEVEARAHPFPWSGDFGHFTANWRGALIGIGAGADCPALHHPHYDFPDALLSLGRDLLAAVVRRLCGGTN
jgi:metal-dependent amidase/aminoacylase/carboxypeptidase family protein